MSSIFRPTPAQRTRRLVVLAAAVFAVVVPLVQNLAGLGLTQAEFAADGNTTLRVAGYAFAIWSLIYLGLMAYAIRQALPQTGESPLISRMGWPSAVALFGIGFWIVVAALNLKVASVGVIFASLLALLIPLLLSAGTIRSLSRGDRDRLLVAWPLAALAGWLTVAAPLNLINAATALNALPERQRLAIVLCYYQEMSNIEAATLIVTDSNDRLANMQTFTQRALELLRDTLVAHSGT